MGSENQDDDSEVSSRELQKYERKNSMVNVVSTFGKIFVFCTLLPGAIGLALVLMLFNDELCFEFSNLEWYHVLFVTYVIGFVGNAFGHAIEIWLYEDKLQSDYCKNIILLYKKGTCVTKKFEEFYDYAENIRVWYWNSAWTIITVLTVRLLSYCYIDCFESATKLVWDPLKFFIIVVASVLVCVLWFLSKRNRSWLNNGVRDITK